MITVGIDVDHPDCIRVGGYLYDFAGVPEDVKLYYRTSGADPGAYPMDLCRCSSGESCSLHFRDMWGDGYDDPFWGWGTGVETEHPDWPFPEPKKIVAVSRAGGQWNDRFDDEGHEDEVDY